MKEYSSLQKKIISFVICNACDEASHGLLNGTLDSRPIKSNLIFGIQ